MEKIGRNDPCPCQSGKKFKNGHIRKFIPTENHSIEVLKDSMTRENNDFKNF